MLKYISAFERLIVILLSLMMALVIFISTIGLGCLIIKTIISPPLLFLDITKLLDIFEIFLLILIGVELFESLKVFMTERAVRVEAVLLVSIIAIARKVIVLDIKQLSGLPIIGLGVIIISLTAGYYLIKQTHRELKSTT